MCLAQKCIVDVGCTLELFLCCKQNKVLVYLGCYTLHYIATCGFGGGVLVPVVGTAMQHILYIYICVGARCRWDGLTHTGVCV